MESFMQGNGFYCCIESLTLWHVTLHPEQHLLGASSWINHSGCENLCDARSASSSRRIISCLAELYFLFS